MLLFQVINFKTHLLFAIIQLQLIKTLQLMIFFISNIKNSSLLVEFSVLMVVATFFIPDSPVYLIRKGKESDARKSLEWLRGKEYIGIEEEISNIKTSEMEINDPKYRISLRQVFSNSVYLKPFALSMGLMFLQQFSGINQVIFYLQIIFEKSGSTLDKGLASFIASIMQVNIAQIVINQRYHHISF